MTDGRFMHALCFEKRLLTSSFFNRVYYTYTLSHLPPFLSLFCNTCAHPVPTSL